MRRGLVLPVLLVLLGSLTGCVERRLFIRTDPPGALVRVNGDEIGNSPVDWRFYYYGKVRVEVEHPGYFAMSEIIDLKAPWYQYPVADFVSDVLTPARVRDDHQVVFSMQKLKSLSEEEVDRQLDQLADAALALREEALAVEDPAKEKNSPEEERPEETPEDKAGETQEETPEDTAEETSGDTAGEESGS